MYLTQQEVPHTAAAARRTAAASRAAELHIPAEAAGRRTAQEAGMADTLQRTDAFVRGGTETFVATLT